MPFGLRRDELRLGEERQVPRSVVGQELSAADLAALEARWLDRDVVEAACLRRVDSFTGSQLVGRRGGDYAGIAIPYFPPGRASVREYRLRRDHLDLELDPTGQMKVRQKYLSPPGRGNMLYLPPRAEAAALSDVDRFVLITEGEFKTLALWRLARWNAQDRAVLWAFSTGGARLARRPVRTVSG